MSDKPKTMVDISAQCACGNTSITVKGPVLTTMLCACTECQRATGTGHATVAMFPHKAVQTTGTLKTFARKADSGATLTRFFCPDCATSLYSTTSRAPDIALVPVGLFAETNWYTPKQIIFNKSRKHWDDLPDDIPAYDTYREDQNAQ